MPLMERVARDIVIALVLGMALGLTLTFIGVGEAMGLVPSSPSHDWEAYWNAAMRLRGGEPLYPQVPDSGAADVFRYPPWFAAAWIPLTVLPRNAVGVIWVLAMFGAAAAALWPLLSSGRWPAVLLGGIFAPFLVQSAIHGNVQPLIVAALVRTIDGRAASLTVGLAASLKGFPILYVIRFAALGEWRAFLTASGVALVMAGPLLFFDLTSYPLSPGPLAGLWLISPLAWAAGALLGALAAVRYANERVAWFTASLAVVLATPRLLYYDMTFLLVTGREPLLRNGSVKSGSARLVHKCQRHRSVEGENLVP